MFPWQLAGNHHVFMWAPEKSCVTMKSAARCNVQTGAGPMTMYFIKWDCKIRPRESVIQCSSNFVKLWDDDTIKQSRNNFLPRYNLIILQSISVLAVGFQIYLSVKFHLLTTRKLDTINSWKVLQRVTENFNIHTAPTQRHIVFCLVSILSSIVSQL